MAFFAVMVIDFVCEPFRRDWPWKNSSPILPGRDQRSIFMAFHRPLKQVIQASSPMIEYRLDIRADEESIDQVAAQNGISNAIMT
jgi:hypothetical protein